MICLLDPITGVRTPTNYEKLSGITGMSESSLTTYKSRHKKIKKINCYIVDEQIPMKTIKQIVNAEKIDGEIWKAINGSDGIYEVSNFGRVRKQYRGSTQILVQYKKTNREWLFVKVKVYDQYKECPVHRLVAEQFITNENEYNCVIHKNGLKNDNCITNLKWVNKTYLGKKYGQYSGTTPVVKIDPETNEILDEYPNMAAAGRDNYLHRETIRQCVRGIRKTAGGYKWEASQDDL